MENLYHLRNDSKRPFWIHLILTLSVLVTFLILANKYNKIQTNDYIKNLFEKELVEREEKLDEMIDETVQSHLQSNINKSEELIKELDEIGALIYLYQNDTLVFWSNNLIDVSNIQNLNNSPVVLFNNGWYKFKEISKEGYVVYGLLLLKNEFAYRNEFLIPNFKSKVSLSEKCEISLAPDELNIEDADGNFLFSIIRDNEREIKSNQTLALFIFYQLSIILLLSLIIKYYHSYGFIIKRKWLIPFLVILDFIILWFLLKYLRFPSLLFESYLFSPTSFADYYHHSLGELLTNSIFILFSAYAVLCFGNRKSGDLKSYIPGYMVWILLFFSVFIAAFLLFEYSIISLIKNSKVTIEFGQDFISNSSISIIVFVVAAGLSLAFYFIGFYIFQKVFQNGYSNTFRIIAFISLLAVYGLIKYVFGGFLISSYLFLATLTIAFIFVSEVRTRISTIHIISFLLIFALYLGALSSNILQKKELEQRRVIVETIANDRDPLAEFNFEKIIEKIISDSMIEDKMYELETEVNEFVIINRVLEYFNTDQTSMKYIPYVTICDTSRLLSDRIESYTINCLDFFNGIIDDIGERTNHPNLFFINNYSINNSYIIRLYYPPIGSKSECYMFIELGSELIPEGLGYPELLIDESTNLSGTELVNYSFAKYMDGELVYNFGDYFYSLNLQNYKLLSKDQDTFINNNYSHILVNNDDKTSFIISKKNKDLIETIAPFSYFFIFLAIYLALFFLVTTFSFEIFKVQISFRNRLQYTLLGIILTSFIVIGLTTMLYLIRLNDKKNHEILSEKAHSVLIELEHKLAGEEKLGPELYETLNTWLVKFSLVFFSDINLYSLDGQLIASSRMQIFDEGLISKLMNVNAYNVLAKKEKLQFIQHEKIGNYKYLSAYVPLRNSDNNLVAYLNLPYFARQTELQVEITTFLVALINIYVLFFVIAIMVTIIISRRITRPLQLIRQNISRIRLGKSNEKINWARQDEIGGLVAEYNRMIDELSNSAMLLVRSEREGAWREMAKQVAHEIKNPLTPMKLSVQYLKKAWDESEKDWDKRLARFTKTIIEQIDSLSEIANAFSDFAKMPVQKTERVDLKHIINNSLELYKENTKVEYVLYLPEDDYFVKADKNQMLRAFNNLIKNSIQALASTKDPQITISVKKSKDELIVVFADNGAGIPKEMADKIFSPSFTTKSSGMGLGLAIVKNIVLNAGGNIWFESKANVGTTFYISLPNA